jgi:hypothetical protein
MFNSFSSRTSRMLAVAGQSPYVVVASPLGITRPTRQDARAALQCPCRDAQEMPTLHASSAERLQPPAQAARTRSRFKPRASVSSFVMEF